MVDRHHARRLAVALGLSLLLHAWLMQSHYGKGVARGGEGAAIAARMTPAGVDTLNTLAMATETAAAPAAMPEFSAASVSTTMYAMPMQAARENTVVAGVAKAASPAPSQPSDPTYYAAGDLDVFPKALVKPDLSAALAATHPSVAGKVRATVLIDEAGVVHAVRGVEPAAPDIEAAVRELLLRTRFTPARNKEGRIVKAQLLVALDYDTSDTRAARASR